MQRHVSGENRCSEDTFLTVPFPNAKAISETSKHSEELEKIKKTNMKLEGEISILRSNILLLEKENYSLKSEKSKGLAEELKRLEQAKKEMKMLMTENRIKDNQLRAFKRTKTNMGDLEVDAKWALEMIDSRYRFSLYPFDYDRLKKLHDFFYEDFKMMLSTDAVLCEVKRIRTCFGDFVKFFLLFCCKKEIFEHFIVDLFCEYGFEDNTRYSKQMFKILKYLPLEWISAFFTNEKFVQVLSEFLAENSESPDAVLFYIRVVETRPFLLSFVLKEDMFNSILNRKDEYSSALLRIMAQKGLSSFINYKNIHLVPAQYLKEFYKNEYIEIDF